MKIDFQSDQSVSASLQIELQSCILQPSSLIFIDFHTFSLVTTQSTNVNRQPCQPSTGNREAIAEDDTVEVEKNRVWRPPWQLSYIFTGLFDDLKLSLMAVFGLSVGLLPLKLKHRSWLGDQCLACLTSNKSLLLRSSPWASALQHIPLYHRLEFATSTVSQATSG